MKRFSNKNNPSNQAESANDNRTKTQKIVSLVANILIYTFCALCVVLLIFAIINKVNGDDTVKIFGGEMRIVVSGSMEKNENTDVSKFKVKSIKTGSVVFIRTVPADEKKADEWYSNLQIGDVLTFKYVATVSQVTVTHRIIDIEHKETGGYIITLKGDNDDALQVIDTSLEEPYNYVIGKVVGKSFLLGYLITTLKKPLGLAFIIIVPCVIIIIMQIINIVNAVNANKRQVADEQAQQRLAELDELKRKIAELEGLNTNVDNEQTSNKEENEV